MRWICNAANGVVVVCALLALLRALDGYLANASADAGSLPPVARLDPTLVLVIGVALGALASFNYFMLERVSRAELASELGSAGD